MNYELFYNFAAKKRKKMKKLLWMIACMTALVACQSDDETPAPTPPARRTVVVYMAGENDLSSYLQGDLNEIKAGRRQAAANENLVVFVDRASSTEKPFIARVTTDEKLDTLYRYAEDFYASNPDGMADVLRRCINLCPALEDYGLVLWGHANGWVIEKDSIAYNAPRRAYGIDTGDNTAVRQKGQWMNIPTLRRVLEQVGITWSFIFADCCNMANIETAYELRNITRYLIGSPAEIPGSGAPYRTVVKDLFIHNDTELYTQLLADYYAQLDDIGGHTPLAAINCEKTKELAEATRSLLPQVSDFLKQSGSTEGMIYYYAWDRRYDREKTLYDMNDVMRTALGADNQDYRYWIAIFDQTVYSLISTRWFANCVVLSDFVETRGGENVFKHGNESFGGISMFFPMEKYNDAAISHPYNESIKKMAWYYAVGWSEAGW